MPWDIRMKYEKISANCVLFRVYFIYCFILLDELKTILHEQCGDYAAEIEQSEEFQALSRDNAEISYSDFIAAALVKRVCLDESQLKMTFERLDEDRAGIIGLLKLEIKHPQIFWININACLFLRRTN